MARQKIERRIEWNEDYTCLTINGVELIEKYCKNCDTTKELKEWGRNSSTKDGLQAWCKVCQNVSSNASHQKKRKAQDLKDAQAVADAMMTKNNGNGEERNLIPKETWDKEIKEIPERVVKDITPFHSFLSNVYIDREGIVSLNKSVVEIIQFYDLNPRFGVDLFYTYFKRDKENNVIVNRKVSTLQEMCRTYNSIIKPKKKEGQTDEGFLLERFNEIEYKVNDLYERAGLMIDKIEELLEKWK